MFHHKIISKWVMTLVGVHFFLMVSAQNATDRLYSATIAFEKDEAMQNAIYSLYVVEDKTGKVFFDKNSYYGLAPASCQKIITCATAFDILGLLYTYTTSIQYDGKMIDHTLKGNLYIKGSGDPSFGSHRFSNTADIILQRIKNALLEKDIKNIDGNIIVEDNCFGTQAIPDGWIWQDIGNYYGAGVWGLNWRENEYDIKLKSSGRIGDDVLIDTILLPLSTIHLISEVTVGKEGSGDNTYIYIPPYGMQGYIRGTIPPNKKMFTIHGSMPYPTTVFLNEMQQYLQSNGIMHQGNLISNLLDKEKIVEAPKNTLLELQSPSLDSLAYWFMQKSLNLYGEALLKTIGLNQAKKTTTESSAEWVQQFWNKKLGLPNSAIQIVDGSGLSPQNRVTTKALVTILQYAKKQFWFNSFYNALPLINGIKMKSGTIYHTKAYSGYITSKNGNSYTFSFIINNFNGKSSYITERMFKLLDILKN